MRTIYKINHWVLFISLLGLIATSLAAEFFFSKQAIMQSFQFSLAEVGVTIPPVDQLFIARIGRRDTWDWHFWIGILFSIYLLISFLRKKEKRESKILNISIIGFYVSGLILFISGLYMFLRLYYQVEDSTFASLKIIHNYSKWIFLIFTIIHIYQVIKLENTTSKGVISNMFRASIFISIFLISFNSNAVAEEVGRDKWLQDNDYIEGMMYLDGKKGLNTILKEISNCPYEKCRKSDISDDNVLRTIKIEVGKPDYKIAVQKLSTATKNGNFLAADKLVDFLIKRVNYKSLSPDKYILELLNEEVGIDYSKYKEIMINAITVGSSSKGCTSSYIGAEIYEKGFMNVNIDQSKANELYKKASENCLENSMYSTLAKKKYNVK